MIPLDIKRIEIHIRPCYFYFGHVRDSMSLGPGNHQLVSANQLWMNEIEQGREKQRFILTLSSESRRFSLYCTQVLGPAANHIPRLIGHSLGLPSCAWRSGSLIVKRFMSIIFPQWNTDRSQPLFSIFTVVIRMAVVLLKMILS